MRIISGKFKGRSILVPKNFAGRPTTDFAREGLFNVLNNLLEWDEMDVADLFAGTGAFGIECLSRGAGSVTFVDMSGLHAKFITDNLRSFDLKDGHSLKQDVFRFLRDPGKPFDLVFADPPYDLENLTHLPDLILNDSVLHAHGILVLEHGKRTDFSGHTHFLQMRSYGNVRFSFFQRMQSSDQDS
jgi:16S rRNA (guanine966-N2)-methyltransferase